MYRGRINGGGDINSLGLLPDKLKTELALHVNLETLRKVTQLLPLRVRCFSMISGGDKLRTKYSERMMDKRFSIVLKLRCFDSL